MVSLLDLLISAPVTTSETSRAFREFLVDEICLTFAQASRCQKSLSKGKSSAYEGNLGFFGIFIIVSSVTVDYGTCKLLPILTMFRRGKRATR